MGIPVRIRMYKNSILASLVSLIGSFINAICKLLALVMLIGMIGEYGFFLGLIFGVIGFAVCVILGSFIQAIIDRLASYIAAQKFARMLKKK